MKSDPTGISEDKSSGSRTMKLVLICSLAMNLLLAGIIGGAMWVRHYGSPLNKIEADFLNVLPSEKREIIAQIFNEHRSRTRPHRRQMWKGQREAIRTLQSDDYNRDQLKAFLDELSRVHIALTKSRYQLIMQISDKLTAEERRMFIQIWRKHLRNIRKALPK